MFKKVLVFGTLGVCLLILGISFYPSSDSEMYYQMYTSISSVGYGPVPHELAEKKLEELATEISDTGKLVFWFPLELAEDQTPYVTSPFGRRPNAMGGEGTEDHNGIDLAVGGNPTNIKVISATSGVVVLSRLYGSAGNVVMVKTNLPGGFPLLIKYFHLKDVSDLQVGDEVVAGETEIGIMGSTGRSGAVHLHFEVELEGMGVTLDESSRTDTQRETLLSPLDSMYFLFDKTSVDATKIMDDTGDTTIHYVNFPVTE